MNKIFVCGDIVNYNNADGMILSKEMSDIVESADYSVCNFEAPVAGYGQPIPKSGAIHYQCSETLNGLNKQGFNLALLANNHIMDFGTKGLEATIETASKSGMEVIGAGVNKSQAYEPLIKEINGMKVGIVNACEAQFGVIDHFKRSESSGYAWINHPLIDKNIIRLKNECDFVLVFAHAGLENYKVPQKEWRERYKHLCDLGADAVIGSHPHIAQGYEQYNESMIFYSLGNFYFDGGRWATNENQSYALELILNKGRPISFEPIFHYTFNGKVQLSSEENKVDLEELCELLGDRYDIEHDNMILDSFPLVRDRLLKSISPFPIGSSLKMTLKEILATLIGRRNHINKDLDAMHFMRNEAYYYVMRHGLEVKAQKAEK
ncbi:CapA family protein [Vibrio sp. Y42_MX_L11]|uniref:CapA family protein n=1 Tax=Vibrio sp. Y42_MX_L11 TaxID=2957765 RepID=UPI0020A30E4D|nr:CapA family protein [Vibrio sp. Y42_MX_L11]